MLTDVLGTIMGFILVMLLLSLIVTSIVQALQSLLRIRARNLLGGIQGLLTTMNIESSKAVEYAQTILKKPIDTTNRFIKATDPTVSWLEPEEFIKEFKKHVKEKIDLNEEEIKQQFDKMGNYLKKRFALRVRYITITIGAIVAIMFQVSATDLLHDLSNSPEMRLKAMELTNAKFTEAPSELTPLDSMAVWEKTVGILSEEYSSESERINALSGVEADRNTLIDSLRMLVSLEDTSLGNAIVTRGNIILDSLYREQAVSSKEKVDVYAADLATLNIRFWPYGIGYYKSVDHILGVLMTIILLSLGAPFWFNILREVAGLRDLLQPSTKKESSAQG